MLRAVGIVVAVAFGGVAVWLIVTGTTQKRLEIGVLLGLWGALLGAYSMFSARRRDPAVASDGAAASAWDGHDLALRAGGFVERSDDAAARQQYEYRLEEMLRRQIHAALGPEVASLRSEVAALRSELVEKVGGQIRLERIETTRVIGSDIEALQQEVRQLKISRRPDDFTDFGPHVAAQSGAAGLAAASEYAATRVFSSESEPLSAQPASRPPAGGPAAEATQVIAVVACEPEPAVHLPAAGAFQPAAIPDPVPGDPFAALPRLTRFTDFALDPIEPTPDPPSRSTSGQRRAEPDEPRRGAPAPGGRHAVSEPPRGGRRRRESGGGDVLAQILERGGAN